MNYLRRLLTTMKENTMDELYFFIARSLLLCVNKTTMNYDDICIFYHKTIIIYYYS